MLAGGLALSFMKGANVLKPYGFLVTMTAKKDFFSVNP